MKWPWSKKIPKYITDQICPDKVEPTIREDDKLRGCKHSVMWVDDEPDTPVPQYVLDIDRD